MPWAFIKANTAAVGEVLEYCKKNNKYRNEFSNVLNQETFEELEINIRKFSYPKSVL